jgi:hypothetical protein
LELLLTHSADVSLLSRSTQLEILKGIQIKPTAAVDDALALRLGRLGGADAVIYRAANTWKICTPETNACKDGSAKAGAEAATELLAAMGASPAAAREGGWPDVPKKREAIAAYATCRTAVSSALEVVAVKGRPGKTAGLDAGCKKALAIDAEFLPAKAGVLAAKALAGDGKVEAELRDVLHELPSDQLAALAIAYLLRDRTDRDSETFKLLAEAERKASNSLDLRRLRAEAFAASDMMTEAYAAFVSALELAPRSPYLHWRTSYMLYLKGSVEKSVEHAAEASRLSGGDHPFYQDEYAGRLIDAGRYAEAQKVLEPVRKQDPKWGRPALRLGFALHMQGQSELALPHLKAAAASKPRDPREATVSSMARIDLARAYSVLGKKDDAFRELAAVQKSGELEAIALKEADFDGLRGDPRFAKLPGQAAAAPAKK